MKLIAALFLLIALIAAPPAIGSEDDSFLIHSTFSSGNDSTTDTAVTWVFHKRNGGEIEVRRQGDPDVVVQIRHENGKPVSVEKNLTIGMIPKKISEDFPDPIVLSDGHPVPYDYLDPMSGQENYTVKKTAGGFVFSQKLTKVVSRISYQEAQQEQLIPPGFTKARTGPTLRMITLLNTGAPVVRQLWPEKGDWWIYEETPVRKSWRMIAKGER